MRRRSGDRVEDDQVSTSPPLPHKSHFSLIQADLSTRIETKSDPLDFTLLASLDRFVDYAMHRVRMLRHHGVTPLMVFDGGPLPAKRGTEVDRASSVVLLLIHSHVMISPKSVWS
jgi:hypothetical protein